MFTKATYFLIYRKISFPKSPKIAPFSRAAEQVYFVCGHLEYYSACNSLLQPGYISRTLVLGSSSDHQGGLFRRPHPGFLVKFAEVKECFSFYVAIFVHYSYLCS